MYVFDCSYHTITITFVPYSVSIREPSYLQVGRSSALGRSSAWRSLGVLGLYAYNTVELLFQTISSLTA